MTALKKINSFYLVFIFVLAIMAVFVIFSFRGIFSALTTSSEVDVEGPREEIRIDKTRLNRAFDEYQNREFVPLTLR